MASATSVRWAREAARLLVVAGCFVGAAFPGSVAQATPLTGFLATPTEQLAVPGLVPGGEITPEGDVYTGWAEYELLAGLQPRPWSQPTRIAPDPGEPLYVADLLRGSIDYRQRVFTTEVAGEPVVDLTLTALNSSARPRRASVGMQIAYTRGAQIPTFDGILSSRYRYPRPAPPTGGVGRYQQSGEAFNPGWGYTIDGRDVTRGGELLVRGPDAPARLQPTRGDAVTSPHARETYTAALAPHGRMSWTWQIPLAPPAGGAAADAALDAIPLTVAQAQFTAFWKRQEAGAMMVTLPERRIGDVYRESLTNILAARYLGPDGWVQTVNMLQYHAYWLRDSSVMTVALDQAGLHAAASENLAFLPIWQQPSGLFISQSGEYDGIGQALWEMDEHALLAGDGGYAQALLPRVSAAVGWIDAQSAADAFGILPPSTVNDDELLVNARITGDEIWAAVGLRAAIGIAQLAGRADLVAAWVPIDARYEANLERALAADEAANGHITPALDVPGGADWGNYGLDYPLEIVPPHSVEVTNILAWERSHSDQGLPGFSCRTCLHDYLGFPIFQTEINRGGESVASALAGLYAETVHTTATGAGWEDGPIGTHPRVTTDNLAPHGTFAGGYVSLLHNLLVDDQSGRVTLLRGVSPAWMAPGDRIAVARAASDDGPVAFTLRVTAQGATLRWSLTRFPGRAQPLTWALPYWVRQARTIGGRLVRGSVALPGDHGSMTLRWSARRPAQSLTRAMATLNRDYTRAGQTAPLRPAPGW